MTALGIYAVLVTMAAISLTAYVLYLQDECRELATDLYRMRQSRDSWVKRAQPSVSQFSNKRGA